jgi:hypothetical protein
MAGIRMRWTRAGWRDVALQLLIGLALFAAPGARADTVTFFTLDTGVSISRGSGVAFGSQSSSYPAPSGVPIPGSVLRVDASDGPGANQQTLTFSNFSIPDILFPGATRLEFVPVDENGLPTDSFTLTLDLLTGGMNEDLADPKLRIRTDKFISNQLFMSQIFEYDLTTAAVSVGRCDTNPAYTVSGERLDPLTQRAALIATGCIGFNNWLDFPFLLRLGGTFQPTGFDIVPEPAPAALVAGGLIALAWRRRREIESGGSLTRRS